MEYSCLKTIANISMARRGLFLNETKKGINHIKPVKIADCKRSKADDVIFQRKRFNWKTRIRQRLNAKICELCESTTADLYEVPVVKNLNELGNSHWETVMEKSAAQNTCSL